MHCTIWYHLYNSKNVENTHGGVLILASNFTKINTLPWVFFTLLKLHKSYQIAQRITCFKNWLSCLCPFDLCAKNLYLSRLFCNAINSSSFIHKAGSQVNFVFLNKACRLMQSKINLFSAANWSSGSSKLSIKGC